MNRLLERISCDLALADEAILRAPPRQLEFLASFPTSQPQLAPRSCNMSLKAYLDVLYRLRDWSTHPYDRATLSECLRLGNLHLQIVGRIQRIHEYLKDCYLLLSTLSALPGSYTPNIGNIFDPIKQYLIDSRASLLSLPVPALNDSSVPTAGLSGFTTSSTALPSIPRNAEATQVRPQQVAAPLNAEETQFVSARVAAPLNAVDTHSVSARVAAPRIADGITNTINIAFENTGNLHHTQSTRDRRNPHISAPTMLHDTSPGQNSEIMSSSRPPLNVYVNEISSAFDELNLCYRFHSISPALPVALPIDSSFPRYYRGSLHAIVDGFEHFSASDYASIAHVHKQNTRPGRHSLAQWIASLRSHQCNSVCESAVYCFIPLRKNRQTRRQSTASNRHLRATERATSILESHLPHNGIVYEPPSIQLRNDIIKEWQAEMGTENQRNGTCACCSRLFRAATLNKVPVDRIDFTLLRNDELPARVLPTSYNFAAYDRALLDPAGLDNTLAKAGTISLCESCKRDLTGKNPLMPVLSLANWLYYGRERLPSDVKDAFESASVFEKSLICRGRASHTTFRYCKNPDSVEFGRNPETSQGYSKGNVMVMPQDSLSLMKSLPPSPDEIRDSMCVLFIGSSTTPLADNIGKLSPSLVRKSRISTMIKFLTSHNPHYEVSENFDGFSQENMDALAAEGTGPDNEFIPAAVEIAQLDPSHTQGELDVTSDYTNRNDAEPDDQDDDNGDMLLENVGFTDGDMSPKNYNIMKLRAIQHCVSGGKYVQSRSGSIAENDFENPRLLSWLFPHLDPWGIGGFHKKRRKRPISMEQQLKYLVSLRDSSFASDPKFAFVYHSISLKKQTTRDSIWRVKRNEHVRVTEKLKACSEDVLKEMEAKFERNPKYQPANDAEKEVIKLLSQIQSMNKKLPGSNGHKLKMRNEIRSLIHRHGAPALFITINPSDVNNPLVRVVAGEDINLEDAERGEDLSKLLRQKLVAKNPHVAAEYFDRVIKAFIKTILCFGHKTKPGLFGKCKAYYGVVEVQGKGTLHCHFLIWLDGHMAPQLMRDTMAEDPSFKERLFSYLESIIKTELPGTTEVVQEQPGVSLAAPERAPGVPNPAVIALPQCAALSEEEFELEFQRVVKDLVIENHWHRHNATCWKYLKRGEPKDDAHCRMGISGETKAVTDLDPETQSVLLRRLHPRINSYNDVLTFLTQSNNDIKFIGSGEGAKALIYYVTDYVTKSTLPTHIGLSALRVVVEKNKKKFDGDSLATPATVSRSLFVKVANGILGRLEVSHQQVMSHIMGGDDHYTSHSFQTLYWGTFHRAVIAHFELAERQSLELNPEALEEGNEEDTDEVVGDSEENTQVMITLGSKEITTNSQYDDYIYRSQGAPFSNCCLYEFAQRFKKVTKRKIDRSRAENTSDEPERARNPSGEFVSEHPGFQSHRLSQTTVEAQGGLARAMLILFKPWRSPADLKSQSESWYAAYDRFNPSPELKTIIQNMLVLHECKDARDADMSTRQNPAFFTGPNGAPLEDIERLMTEIDLDEAYQAVAGDMDECEDRGVKKPRVDRAKVARALGVTLNNGEEEEDRGTWAQHMTLVLDSSSSDKQRMAEYAKMMAGLKRKRGGQLEDETDEEEEGPETTGTHNRRKRRRTNAVTTTTTLEANADALRRRRLAGTASTSSAQQETNPIREIISDFNLDSNPEQLRAFKIVADRVVRGGDQLLMYVGGVGGTGKSHLIKAIVALFEGLGRRRELQLSAPTGAAGVIIDGATIHSLTLLPNKQNVNGETLAAIWNGKTFLVLDEISMVGAGFLADISTRISMGKGVEQPSRETPFGSINVLFTGDFGQLKPVGDRTLYSNRLVGCVDERTAASARGQNEILGAAIWRQVSDVVLLKKNQRQLDDPLYADLLGRIRSGTCIGRSNNPDKPTDHQVLSARVLSRLAATDPTAWDLFADAPVIVGLKEIRDAANEVLLRRAAAKLHVRPVDYHSVDKLRREVLPEPVQQLIWNCPSNMCGDALGILPLFCGMKVMITENLAINNKLVNGAEGVVRHVDYSIDDHGRRYVKVCYVLVKGSNVQINGYDADVVPIQPVPHSFTFKSPHGDKYLISRQQLPLVPAYSYTDYKSQGRTLERAIVDLSSAQAFRDSM